MVTLEASKSSAASLNLRCVVFHRSNKISFKKSLTCFSKNVQSPFLGAVPCSEIRLQREPAALTFQFLGSAFGFVFEPADSRVAMILEFEPDSSPSQPELKMLVGCDEPI